MLKKHCTCERGNYKLERSDDCLLHGETLDLLVVDECHRIKSPRAQRTRQIKGFIARRRLYLTGTPIVNRPSELWTLISDLDPTNWNQKTYWQFINRYCNAQRNRFGLKTDGHGNLAELQHKLRSTILIRRLKSEVLTELPPKVRQVIELPAAWGASIRPEHRRRA